MCERISEGVARMWNASALRSGVPRRSAGEAFRGGHVYLNFFATRLSVAGVSAKWEG
jgi:hypothetical protein